jgi:hypothetical protein
MKKLVTLAVLIALASVLRLVFNFIPDVTVVTALFFALSLQFGFWEGFVVAAGTMLVTGLLLPGFGPIVFGQILGYGLILSLFCLLALVLPWQMARAVLAALLCFIYGAFTDVFSGWIFGFGKAGFIGYWLAGLPYDSLHALSTLLAFPVILLILTRIEKMRQINHKV